MFVKILSANLFINKTLTHLFGFEKKILSINNYSFSNLTVIPNPSFKTGSIFKKNNPAAVQDSSCFDHGILKQTYFYFIYRLNFIIMELYI